MSNLIKYYNFNVTEDDKLLLENDKKVDNFIPGIFSHGEVEVRDLEQEEFDREFPEEMFGTTETDEDREAKEQLLETAHEEADAIVEQARQEAETILEQAKVEANFEKEQILEDARKSGYKDGMIQANDEMNEERKSLELRKEQLEGEYHQLIQELEPNFVKLVMSLVQKMTGILVEDHKEIILYLMEQSLTGLGKTTSLSIRVSEEDIEMVRGAQERIRQLVSDNCDLEIRMDPSFTKNQCVIEADKQIIDCSLGVQLQNLMEDLKMLM